jgi:hypothetical protein
MWQVATLMDLKIGPWMEDSYQMLHVYSVIVTNERGWPPEAGSDLLPIERRRHYGKQAHVVALFRSDESAPAMNLLHLEHQAVVRPPVELRSFHRLLRTHFCLRGF